MRSVSVGVNSRAPRRISTLLSSFMFGSPFIIGSVERARAMKLALADEYVAVSLALRIDRAECGGTKSSTHALHFLSTQITSAPANQYSVQVIHVLSPFVV